MNEYMKKWIRAAGVRAVKTVAQTAAAKKALDVGITCGYETELVKKLSVLTDRIAVKVEELEDAIVSLHRAEDITSQSYVVRDSILPKMNELRIPCDEAETLTAKNYWPFPTYGDLLFGVR